MEAEPEASDKPLTGRRILVPESRELDLFARMLEERGAEAVRCPMVTILDVEDPTPVEAWLGRLAAGAFDDLILLTGEGLRRLLGVAQRAGIAAEAIAALKRMRTITRGPKPARALRELGLAPGLAAEAPTTEGVIATLGRENLGGRNVGVQLYPGNPNRLLLDFLRGAGAQVDAILPYRYASDAESGQVEAAIRDMAAGAFDAIAFTSTPQLARLQDVAKQRGLEPELRQGLARLQIAAVGPVVAGALEKQGFSIAAMPASFHLKPLIGALVAALAKSAR
ncbi:MAG TPA: uroporphyrinogen-III synthase [Stellaceae bacterium]|jgi:uroporphyrinogen-III synthase|nr:uroporphyrinogen-III synthase [Stellaceae bacterium]